MNRRIWFGSLVSFLAWVVGRVSSHDSATKSIASELRSVRAKLVERSRYEVADMQKGDWITLPAGWTVEKWGFSECEGRAVYTVFLTAKRPRNETYKN